MLERNCEPKLASELRRGFWFLLRAFFIFHSVTLLLLLTLCFLFENRSYWVLYSDLGIRSFYIYHLPFKVELLQVNGSARLHPLANNQFVETIPLSWLARGINSKEEAGSNLVRFVGVRVRNVIIGTYEMITPQGLVVATGSFQARAK